VQIIHISGFLSRDPEVSTTQGGDKVCRLNVPVKQGWGEKEQTNWFRVSVWGKRADSLANNLRKGVKVNVVGELTIGEYEGKPQYDVRAMEVDFPPAGKRDDGLTHQNQDGFNRRERPSYDDDQEVPF
jgi:single-strand DNA-binding protein